MGQGIAEYASVRQRIAEPHTPIIYREGNRVGSMDQAGELVPARFRVRSTH